MQSRRRWVDAYDLLDFCDNVLSDPSKKIYQIAKLAPPDPSETEIWRWKKIKEIWRCKDHHRIGEIFYFTNDGNYETPIEGMPNKKNSPKIECVFIASEGNFEDSRSVS